MSQSFLIQRYSGANWPQIRGEVPFLATGDRFFQWAVRGSLAKYNEHRFVPSLRRDIEQELAGVPEDLAREVVAEMLLEQGIVQALWTVHGPTPLMDRWRKSIEQLSLEIPKGPIGEATIEFLSGLGDPGHFHAYVAADEIKLVPVERVAFAGAAFKWSPGS